MGIHKSCNSMVQPFTNGLIERCNGVVYAGIRKMITAYLETHWIEVIGNTLAGLHLMPSGIGL